MVKLMTEEVREEGVAEHNMLIVNNEGDGDGAGGGDALVRGNMVQVGYAGCAGWEQGFKCMGQGLPVASLNADSRLSVISGSIKSKRNNMQKRTMYLSG